MTTATATPTRTVEHAGTHRLTGANLLRSEAIKVTTLRSTWWSLGIALVLSLAISCLIAASSRDFPNPLPPISAILSPTQFTMLVAGILGAIVITGEYSTGMIRSTLTAEPRRGAVLIAKAVVIGVIMALATAVTYAVSIAATAPLLATGIDWGTPADSIIPLSYGVLSMVSFTLLGLGVGFIVRNGAGAIAITVGILFVLPIVFQLFSLAGESWQWLVDLGAYLPMTAASTLTAVGATDVVAPLLTLIGWAILPLIGGWVLLRSRDA